MKRLAFFLTISIIAIIGCNEAGKKNFKNETVQLKTEIKSKPIDQQISNVNLLYTCAHE